MANIIIFLLVQITELHGLGVSVSEPARNMVAMALSAQKEVELDLKIPLRDAKSSISNVEVANNITGTALGNFEKYTNCCSLVVS